jgi:hypothetical protein
MSGQAPFRNIIVEYDHSITFVPQRIRKPGCKKLGLQVALGDIDLPTKVTDNDPLPCFLGPKQVERESLTLFQTNQVRASVAQGGFLIDHRPLLI